MIPPPKGSSNSWHCHAGFSKCRIRIKLVALLKLLNEKQVDYATIGAHACAALGHVRATRDMDILINPSRKNITRLKAALEEFGFDTTDATIEDFQKFKILPRQYWLDFNISPFAKGVSTKEALKNKISAKCEGVSTYFVSLEDLIKIKKAASRPKDREDVRSLKEIAKQKKQ